MSGRFMFCNSKKLLFLVFYVFIFSFFSFAQNSIVTENALPGNPFSEWGVPDFRDNRIAGFSTKMSLNRGETVRFKINVQGAANYTLKIYRIGYYGGNGAHLKQDFGTLNGTIQPAGISNATTGLLDCSNWSESASWNIPSTAVSGFYIAKLERSGGGSNHIAFIVRNDASTSDLYLQFPDATWQAYNGYGGNSMYDGNTGFPAGHAVKVSYNRPFFPYNTLFNTDGRQADWYMNATYPMIRWLERNGYDVTYTGSNDVDNNGGRLLNHKVFISLGHDEYVSKNQRSNIEAARNAGVHLAFFSGNEVYWKTRWESNDGSEDRTLVCYKEGLMGDGSINERVCGNKCDASSPEWTGLWRTGGNYDAGKPENGLTGQISWVEFPSEIAVPAYYKKLRFWRNTSIPNLSAGQTASLGINTLGYEWDYEQPLYAGSYPAGRITMSSKTVNSLTHKLSLYRHTSGALVFGAGTVQWSWGLDGQHWGGSTVVSPEMQQATVNLFADMGVQPGSLQSGLSTVSQSTDFTAPGSTITAPLNGASFPSAATINISGTATDAGGGVVAGVEVSVDGGGTWRVATVSSDLDGTVTWSYSWATSSTGSFNIKSRGIDDSGNKGNGGTGIIVNVGPPDVIPPTVSSVSPLNGTTGVSTGTTVTANFNEVINSLTVTGTTFQLRDAGNNLVAATVNTLSNQITLTPSVALSGSIVYTVTIIGGASGVKDLAGNALVNNYIWSFTTTASGTDNTPPTVSSVSPVNGETAVNIHTTVAANFNEAINASTVTGSTFQLRDPGSNLVSATVGTSSNQIILTPTAALATSTTYTVTIVGGASGVKDLAGNALVNNYSWSFTTGTETSQSPVTIQSFTTRTGNATLSHALTGVPAGALLVLATTADVAPTDCSVLSTPSLTWTKRVDAGASQSDNAEIWTAVYSAGGSITVTSNWGAVSQTSVCYIVLNAEPTLGGAFGTAVLQAAPSVTITTTRDNSIIFGCTADWNAVNGTTRTLRDGATERLYFKDGNYTTYHYTKAAASIAAYTEGVSLPTGQQASTALLEIRSNPVASDIIPPGVSSVTPVNGATGVSLNTTVTANFSEAINSSTVSGTTFQLKDAANNVIAASVTTSSNQITLTPSATLAGSTVYSVLITGGASGVKDLAGNAMVNDYIWSFTTVAIVDNSPPTVSSVSPLNGATGVNINSIVTANFNEAINGLTVTGTTFQLKDASNNVIPASVSTSTNQVTLTPSAALANLTVYSVTITGGVSGVKDLAGNTLVNDFIWSFTTSAVVENTPPTVIAALPANAAIGVSTGTTIIANFSEAVNGSSVTGTTFQLKDAGNNIVPASVSTSSSQITLIPSAALLNSAVYTVTITGGVSGVKDLAGNALVNDYSWSFTTAPAGGGGGSITIFQPTNTPAVPLANDGQGIVLGMKFRSTQNGFITGIRYYKGTGTTGTHTGHLWSNTGVQLAAATFTGETASGWQQVLFSSPVAITAGVTYVASYFSPSGHYAATKPYFTQAVVNGPLRGLADGEDGPNGLYSYSPTSVFPNSSFQSSNYWVDVVFTTGGTPIPVVTLHPSSQTVCAGTNVNFTSAATGGTPAIQWQSSTNGTTWTNISGATNSVLTFVTATADNNKQYRAIWTNSGGSVSSNPATLVVNTVPASPAVSVINNCANSTLTASGFAGVLLWSTGETTPSITVATAGNYTVTQTLNGCTSAAGASVAAPKTIPSAPTVTVVNNCGSSLLSAGSFGGSLLWSTGETTPFITVTTAGIYTLTQTIDGCISATGSGTAAPLNSSVATPSVNVVNNCGYSVLTATGFTGTLLWSTGATTESINVATAGTYTVTQTVGGCTSAPASGTTAPLTIPSAPTVTVANNCGTSTLTATGFALLWSTGETTPSILVTTAGTYTVTQTVSGCTSVSGSGIAAPKTVPSAPTVTVVNNCGSSVLTAGSFTGTLLWSTGDTTSFITVSTAGTYTVTQTIAGCTSASGNGTAAPLNSNVPTPTITVVNNCVNSELTATGVSGSLLLWSTGATTPSITVTAGTYTVTQTVSGCTSAAASGTAAPKGIPPPPTVTVSDNCGNSELTAGSVSGSLLLWSNGATTSPITVTTAGTYTVTQTINGCTSAAGSGAAAPKTIPAAPTVTVVNNCGNSELTASGTGGTLLWSNGATTSPITVTTAGTYTVTRIINGCSSPEGSGTAAPLNSDVPTPTITVVNNCVNSELTATGVSGSLLLWSTGATTPSITVTAGTYTVTQTVSGCTSAAASGTAAPKGIPLPPTVTGSDNCGNSELTAGSVSGSLLLWSNGATTSPITVTTAGTYTVTQTVNGCTSLAGSGTAAPKAIPVAPTVTVVNNCGNSELTASGTGGTLLWSNGATTSPITVTTAGTYTVTRIINGCSSPEGSGTAAPLNSNVPTPTITVVNNCVNSELTATGVSGSLLVWSTGATTASITVTAGTYTVTQTVSGCTSAAASGTAAPKGIPLPPTVTVSDNCGNSELTAGSVSESLLLWSTGATTSPITVTTAGTYTVTQTVNGCTSAAGSGAAAPKAIPGAPTVTVVNNCGNSELTASGTGGTLLWSNGATTSTITVTTGGTYSVTRTVGGCSSPEGSGTAAPLNSNVATPAINVVNNCGNSVLTASGFTGSLLWSTGATTAFITVTTAGTYTVTQTVSGCTSAAGNGVAAPKTIPVLSSNLAASATTGIEFIYTPTSTTAGTTFTWSRAAISGISNAASSGAGNITETLVNTTSSPVNVTYVYTLTASGCNNTQNVVVTVNPVQTINCLINGSITSSFNSTAIPAGRYIWFNSVFDRGSFSGVTGPVTFNVTNSKITFTANSQQYVLNVPDARIRYDAAVTSASTQFINNVWETAVPRSYTGYAFMNGLSYQVPSNLPGGITNVKWTADINIDKTGITISWKWAAAVYTSFAGHTGLNIKPINGSTQNPYPNSDKAGTPENFKAFLISGAKGTGGTNYTGNYSGTSTATCTTSGGQRSSGQSSAQSSPQQLDRRLAKLSAEKLVIEKFDVHVMPNPTTHFFNLVINGKNNLPVSVRVVDIFGRVMEKHENMVSGNIIRLGQKWKNGTYFAEVIQGDQRKVVKIIKAN